MAMLMCHFGRFQGCGEISGSGSGSCSEIPDLSAQAGHSTQSLSNISNRDIRRQCDASINNPSSDVAQRDSTSWFNALRHFIVYCQASFVAREGHNEKVESRDCLGVSDEEYSDDPREDEKGYERGCTDGTVDNNGTNGGQAYGNYCITQYHHPKAIPNNQTSFLYTTDLEELDSAYQIIEHLATDAACADGRGEWLCKQMSKIEENKARGKKSLIAFDKEESGGSMSQDSLAGDDGDNSDDDDDDEIDANNKLRCQSSDLQANYVSLKSHLEAELMLESATSDANDDDANDDDDDGRPNSKNKTTALTALHSVKEATHILTLNTSFHEEMSAARSDMERMTNERNAANNDLERLGRELSTAESEIADLSRQLEERSLDRGISPCVSFEDFFEDATSLSSHPTVEPYEALRAERDELKRMLLELRNASENVVAEHLHDEEETFDDTESNIALIEEDASSAMLRLSREVTELRNAKGVLEEQVVTLEGRFEAKQQEVIELKLQLEVAQGDDAIEKKFQVERLAAAAKLAQVEHSLKKAMQSKNLLMSQVASLQNANEDAKKLLSEKESLLENTKLDIIAMVDERSTETTRLLEEMTELYNAKVAAEEQVAFLEGELGAAILLGSELIEQMTSRESIDVGVAT